MYTFTLEIKLKYYITLVNSLVKIFSYLLKKKKLRKHRIGQFIYSHISTHTYLIQQKNELYLIEIETILYS